MTASSAAQAAPISSRIARLRAALASAGPSGRRRALDAFWSEIEAAGTPLIESAGGAGQLIVTFLWRVGVDDRGLTGPADPVMVLGGPALWWEIEANVLELVPDSDVLYRSYAPASDLRGRYVFSPGDPLTPLPAAGTADSVVRMATFRPDPRNRAPLVLPTDDPLRPSITYSTFALPDATPTVPRDPSAPRGDLRCAHLDSTVLGNRRRVWIYRPHTAAAPATHLLLMLDGRDWIEWVPLIPMLDTLIAQGKVPPVAVVLPESLDTATRYRELTCRPSFTEFLTDELLPWAARQVAVPDDPARIALHGFSFGGLAAAFAGWSRPDVFGTVLAQSGSFWWSDWDRADSPPVEQLVDRFNGSERRPGLRLSLDIGTLEGQAMLGSHERMAQALRDNNYPLRTHVFSGGHDLNCWWHELPAALAWWSGIGSAEHLDPSGVGGDQR